MSRMERVKDALNKTIAEYSKKIEISYSKNKNPHDYSLGFVNALIFIQHQLDAAPGEPKFFDRKGSIGSIPKPSVLSDDEEKFRIQNDFYIGQIVTQARGLIENTGFNGKEIEIGDLSIVSLIALKKAIQEHEEFFNPPGEDENDKSTKIEQEVNGVENIRSIKSASKEQHS